MGLKAYAAVLAVGAGLMIAYPDTRRKIEGFYESSRSTLSDLLGERGRVLRPLQQPSAEPSPAINSQSPVRLLQQPFLFNLFSKSDVSESDLHWNGQPIPSKYSDGTPIRKETYQGLVWPDKWPTVDKDGNTDRDYGRWLIRQNRR